MWVIDRLDLDVLTYTWQCNECFVEIIAIMFVLDKSQIVKMLL